MVDLHLLVWSLRNVAHWWNVGYSWNVVGLKMVDWLLMVNWKCRVVQLYVDWLWMVGWLDVVGGLLKVCLVWEYSRWLD